MWLYLGITAAFILGFFDISKKHAVNANAVLPVQAFSTLSAACAAAVLLIISHFLPELAASVGFNIPHLEYFGHLHILAKTCIMTFQWILAYMALRHLPVTVASSIRASGPVWTLLGAVLLFGERPTVIQWCGLIVIFISYYAFSLEGVKEGIVFHKNKWVMYMFLSTFVGTFSTLYDKYLVQSLNYSPMTVLTWMCIYLSIVSSAVAVAFRKSSVTSGTPFRWRWSIPLVGLTLIMADFFYFQALSCEGALIAVLSTFRRSSVVVSFIFGGFIFKETNKFRKALALAGIMAGVIILILN